MARNESLAQAVGKAASDALPATGEAIVVENLVKRYGQIRAVDGLSFAVQRSEIFALLGPNGAGKTTTVETLEGYRKPDAGHVRVLGLDPIKQGRTLKQQIGLMLQQTAIYENIRVGEAVGMFASYYAKPQDATALIAKVGLESQVNASFGTLSGGQKQRLSLALALVGNPRLVFLDEPTASMDPQARLQTWELIRRLRESGITVLLTTHYMEEAQRLADRVAIIDHGKLLAIGTPEELIGASAAEIITFSGPAGLSFEAMEQELGDLKVQEERPGSYAVRTSDSLAGAAWLHGWSLQNQITISDFRVSSTTLEDIFLQLTGSEVRD